ncbi:hypothetical protein SDC9_142529 [bioreactor metagenome]|uniref:Uncharacterized protein n=1 Tax=bioreactor metagenome TaxID=1076179 RepID=A0A645E1H4_9ZZZZ
MVGKADVAEHRAALLCQAGHVEHGDALAVEMGRHADQRADGHDPGAANPGYHDAVGAFGGGQRRVGQGVEARFVGLQCLTLAHLATFDSDEAWTEAVQAGVVLVAGRLIDAPLAPEFGFHRQDGHAVGLGAAVAAALAYRLIDEDPPCRIGEGATLAPAPLLGCAGLVVDQCGDATGCA